MEYKCPRCNGRGFIPSYKHVQDGICFECGGKGLLTKDEHDLIQKNLLKEENRRKQNIEKSRANALKKFKKETFKNSDAIYFLKIKNTYEIKEELKNKGAIYYGLGLWYFTTEPKEYPVFKIEWAEIEPHTDEYLKKFTELLTLRQKEN